MNLRRTAPWSTRALWVAACLTVWAAEVPCADAPTPAPTPVTIQVEVPPELPATLTTKGAVIDDKVDEALLTPPKTGELFEKLLKLNLIQEPELDLEAARREFASLLDQTRKALAESENPNEQVAALNRVLLRDRAVSYVSNLTWRDSTLAASLLRKKGNCLSTSVLYAVVADALNLPIKVILAPQHAFVRWELGDDHINIETTAKGRELPDASYLEEMTDLPPADMENLAYMRPLSLEQLYGELLYNAGSYCNSQRRLVKGVRLLETAKAIAPRDAGIELSLIVGRADLTKDREAERGALEKYLQRSDIGPTCLTRARMDLASVYSGNREYKQAHAVLLEAYAKAPKSQDRKLIQELAFCSRSLRDFTGALRYMELAQALLEPHDPAAPATLYNLAGAQYDAGRLDEALATIEQGLQLNPEKWNLLVFRAGITYLKGDHEEGLRLFHEVPVSKVDRVEIGIWSSWFYVITGHRDAFYAEFAKALEAAEGTSVLEWVDQDKDLDVYRKEPEFQALVEKNRARLLGKK